MKKVFAICLLLIMVSCAKEKQGNMIVKGQIKGLKKGTLYLQKMKDTVIVSVDSISLLGKDEFVLSDNIDTPEMYYLTFDENIGKRVMFFGEKGTITVNDDISNFGVHTEIIGSKNQKVYDEYMKVTSKFQYKQLDLFKANIEAQQKNDLKKSDSLRKLSESNLRRRYLYTVNFALANPDAEATAYIALVDLVDANIKLLDTVNNSLTDKVKNSVYGKKLDTFISDIKKSEQK